MGRGWVARLGSAALRGAQMDVCVPRGVRRVPRAPVPAWGGEGQQHIPQGSRGAAGAAPRLCCAPSVPGASTQGGDEGTHNSGVPCHGRGRCAALAQAAPACPGPLVPRLGMLLFSNLFNGINPSEMDNPCFPHLMLKIHCMLKTSCRNDFGCF